MTRAAAAWNRFWFAPQPTSTLAVFRICFAAIAIAWTASLLPDLRAFYAAEGIVPADPRRARLWSVLEAAPDAALPLGIVMLVACVALLVGLRTRLAAVLVFAGLLTFQRRNPFIHNSGDVLLRVMALYLALAPAGAALSIDRWRRDRGGFWLFPVRAPWALRLVQIQLTVLYVATVWAKLRGTTWNDGTAVSYAMRIGDLERFPLPASVETSLVWANLFTYGTLATEFALAVLVWNRRARPWVLAAGVLMHLGIEYTLLVGYFTLAILAAYVAFVPPDTMSRWILRARARLSRV